VFVQYLRFANFGKLPIQNADTATVDPLRVEATGGNPLSLSLVNSSREVCQIALSNMTRTDQVITSRINFDFLDYQDGGLIQIISESPKTKAFLNGTIVGMPEGLARAKPPKDGVTFPEIGCVIPLILEFLCIVAVPFVYRHIVGSWNNVWVLILPIAAILLPLVVTLPVVFYFTGRQRFRFPSQLQPPRHYYSRVSVYMHPRVRRNDHMLNHNDKNNAQQQGGTAG
jgi:hypothetical protein